MTAATRNRFIHVFFAMLFVIVVYGLWLYNQQGHNYIVGDWQINYAGGFVRRGLLGELIRIVADSTGLDNRIIVLIVQAAAYAVFFAFAASLSTHAADRFPLFLFLVLSPLTFAFGPVGPDGSGRKEVLYLASLVVHAALLLHWQGRKPRMLPYALALAGLFSTLTLIHEMHVLFVPFHLLLTAVALPWSFAELCEIAAVSLIPASAAAVASAVFHGDTGTVVAICDSLGTAAPAECEKHGAIWYLAIGGRQAIMSIYYEIWTHARVLTVAVLSAALGVLPFLIVLADRRIRTIVRAALINRTTWIATLMSFSAPLPLFVVASDYGRWMHMFFTSFAVVLAVLLIRTDSAGEASTVGPTRGWKLADDSAINALAILSLAAYALLWHAPGVCCIEEMGTGFLGRAVAAYSAWAR